MAYFKLPGVRHNYQGPLGGFMFSNGVCTVPDDHEVYAAAKNILVRYYAAKEYREYPPQQVNESGDSSSAPKGSTDSNPDVESTDGKTETSPEEHDDGQRDGLRSDAPEKPVVDLGLTEKQKATVYKAIDSLDPTNGVHWSGLGIPNADFIYRLTDIRLTQTQISYMAEIRGKSDGKAPRGGSKDNPKTKAKAESGKKTS